MIHLDKEDWILLKHILIKYPYKFYVYGSRTKGNYKKFSDLDLCIIEKIDDKEFFELQSDLEESDLSIKVDVKRWFVDMDKDFRLLVKQDLVVLSHKNLVLE